MPGSLDSSLGFINEPSAGLYNENFMVFYGSWNLLNLKSQLKLLRSRNQNMLGETLNLKVLSIMISRNYHKFRSVYIFNFKYLLGFNLNKF